MSAPANAKRLILMRHAKSDWRHDDLQDYERPLARRGRLAAPLMGAWLREMGYAPEAALCSSAVRARETWALVRPMLPEPPEPVFHETLYLADPSTILAHIHAADEEARSLLVIGHNPGFEALVSSLMRDRRAGRAMPTAAIAVFLFMEAQNWRDLTPQSGELVDYACPKELV